MSWETVFVNGFGIADFYEIVDSFGTPAEIFLPEPELEIIVCEEVEKVPAKVVCSPKSPRRRTFGAQFQDLKDEITNLKIELELRDAQIFALLDELKYKKK